MSSDAVRTDSPDTGRQTATEVAILDELHELFQHVRTPPPQFQNLLTACQYLPIYRLTKKHAKPGMEVLDWGSGNGHFSYFLLRHGMTVTGFNLGAESCALAPRLVQLFPDRYHIQYGAADEPVRLPFRDRQFDMVFSIGVLEHVRETGGSELQSLAEIRRVLRPGGRFLCGMLPKRYSWIEFLVRNYLPHKHYHKYRFVEQSIRQLLEESGFELLEIHSHGILPRNSLNGRMFGPLHDRPWVAKGFNVLDGVLTRCMAPLAQNMMLCARSA